MTKIVKSLAVIAFVAAIAVGATSSYFSDTETSTGNTFTAGAIDLKVDSTQHYNGNVCAFDTTDQRYEWTGSAAYPVPGTSCDGTWVATDLGAQRFFAFSDLKPGDHGEDTISLHVYDNDAWGRMTITGLTDTGNTCVDPEIVLAADADCFNGSVGVAESNGELRENTKFSFWLDQGTTPGFQGKNTQGVMIDPQEGDNTWQPNYEPLLSGVLPFGFGTGGVSDGIIVIGDEVHKLWVALAAVRTGTSACAGTPVDGHNGYGLCHGLAVDGRLVGSATYYFGAAWQIPYAVGNEAQSDGFTGNLKFEAVQHRNNPGYGF